MLTLRGLVTAPRCRSAPDSGSILEELAFEYGAAYDSYLAIEPGRKLFWSSDRSGVLTYARDGRFVHVSGGLLAPDHAKERLLDEFLNWADTVRCRSMFFNITPTDVPLFRARGFEVTLWGDDQLVPLGDCTWQGKPYEWVRRQTNYALRHGLDVEECSPEWMNAHAWNLLADELHEISRLALAFRPQVEEIGFLNGRLDLTHLGRRRLFIARFADSGRIDGFVICNPCRGGREWAIDLCQHRPDAVRGTVPFLIHQALQRMQGEGVERVSLCVVPAFRWNNVSSGESRLVRNILVLSRYFSCIFDAVGMAHFKSRFRPIPEPRYLCARPRATWRSMWSFIRVCGALRLSSRKLVRTLWHQLCRIGRRGKLVAS
jgi:phosphatidylglycerol lysyltransferase